MIISSAHIFAKQITSGISPLPDNVYFDGGRFNPIYVGNDFDFNDSIIVRDSFSDAQWDAMHATQYINARKVLQAVGTTASAWTIDNGELVLRQENPYSSTSNSMSMVFLPIAVPREKIVPYTTRMNVTISQSGLASGQSESTLARDLIRKGAYNSSYLDWVDALQIGPSGNTSGYVDKWCDYFPIDDPTTSDPIYFGIYVAKFEEVRIKKMWLTGLAT